MLVDQEVWPVKEWGHVEEDYHTFYHWHCEKCGEVSLMEFETEREALWWGRRHRCREGKNPISAA